MSSLEPELDMMVSDEEEPAKEKILPSKKKPTVKPTVSSSNANTAKLPQSSAAHQGALKMRKSLGETKERTKYFPLLTSRTSGQREEFGQKLKEVKTKLKKKTNNQLADLYNSTEHPFFREIIRNAFHEKCMAALEDLDKHIQAQE